MGNNLLWEIGGKISSVLIVESIKRLVKANREIKVSCRSKTWSSFCRIIEEIFWKIISEQRRAMYKHKLYIALFFSMHFHNQNKFLMISAPATNVPMEAPILAIKTTRIILKNLFLKNPLKENISSGIL